MVDRIARRPEALAQIEERPLEEPMAEARDGDRRREADDEHERRRVEVAARDADDGAVQEVDPSCGVAGRLIRA